MTVKQEEDKTLKERSYLLLLPLITLSAAVWFTPTKVGVYLAFIFTTYLFFLGFLFSSYLWTINKRIKNKHLRSFSLKFFFICLIGTIYSVNYLSINSLIPVSLLLIYFLNSRNKYSELFPLWLRSFSYKIGVIVFICLMNILAFWFNPYSQPIKFYLNEF